ncbi:MAG: DUF4113 domain-containing protein [Polaromonas sp.]|nr:DUF4113 domain-containing protein [Polaromonas sp.]
MVPKADCRMTPGWRDVVRLAGRQRGSAGARLGARAGLQGKERTWSMRQDLLTPQYTTRCGDVPVARA